MTEAAAIAEGAIRCALDEWANPLWLRFVSQSEPDRRRRWALGLAMHGLVVALALGGWRDRMLAREVDRLRASR